MWHFALLIAGLVIWRAVLPLPLTRVWKTGIAAAVLAAAFKFQILHFFGGPMFFAPNLPGWLVLAAAWIYAVLFLFFFLLAAAETGRIAWRSVLRFRKRSLPENWRRNNNRMNIGLLILALMLASGGLIAGLRIPAVRRLDVAIRNLPPEAENLRVVLLADLHVDKLTRAGRIQAIVDKVNALRPDVVVIAGDFVDGRTKTCGPEILPLQKLAARYGVFGVPGNHEYYSGCAEWLKFLPRLGVRMLVNESVVLPVKIRLAGIADKAGKRGRGPAPDWERTFRDSVPEIPTILLMHRPAEAAEAAARGAALQLSGHTHGGMIRGLDLGVALFNGGFVSGFYRVNGMPLYVSNGTCIWNGFPVRIGRSSEITLLRLIREK